MKPDWSSPNVPDWAMWAAQEASGAWYWYAERPVYSEICTEWQTRGKRQIIPKVELSPQATLEARPRPPMYVPTDQQIEVLRLLATTQGIRWEA